MNSKSTHAWKFFRAGGFDQVKLDSGADLGNLDQLDQKLWVALACPTGGLEFDPATLALIDTDKDGRVRAPELIAAAKWLIALLKNPDDALKGASSLPLAAINDATAEGGQLLAAAKQILVNLGKPDVPQIELGDVTDTAKIFAQTKFNGDGVVPADATDDPGVKAVIDDIITCCGAEADRSGKPGVNQAKLDQFFAEADACAAWWTRSETDPAILPLGDATAGALAAVNAVKAKIEDYFARCRLAAFDARAAAAMNRDEKDYASLAVKELSISSPDIAGWPLARIEAGQPLPLAQGINPSWTDAIAALRASAVKPLLGERSALTESDWAEIRLKLAPFESWMVAKAGAVVEKLGLKRVREILKGDARERIAALIARDLELAPQANTIAAVERLVRYHRDIYLLCTNFVSFKDFYDGGAPAIFQAGTLYLDQRSCEFTLPVENAARHAALAGLAGTYLAYCDCVRKGSGEKRQIVAAFTNGDSDNLMVGRNGIFYDRKGRDWDATITKIVDNPISVRQAFWSPYKKLVRLIEEQVAKRAAAAEKASDSRLSSAATSAASADKVKPAEAKKVDVGTVAALGVAFGAIGTMVTTIVAKLTGLVSLPFFMIVLAFLGILLIISGPSMLIAWLKLRKRNLGPILDANGWAVNAKARINVPFGTSLTGIAHLPPGASLRTDDKFGESPSPWPKIIGFIVAVCFLYSLFNHYNWAPRLQPGGITFRGKMIVDWGKKSGEPVPSVVGETNAPVNIGPTN